MRRLIAVLIFGTTLPLSGQTVARVGVGMTGGTEFVKDFIVEPIGTKQSLSPTLVVAGMHTLASGYRVGLEIRYASGNQEVSVGNTTDEIAGLGTLGVSLLADGPLRGALRWEATLGMLKYRPETESGVFSRGGPTPLLIGGGITWGTEVSPDLTLVVGGRYDFHSFNSARLDADSYAGSQAVHRGSLTVSIERVF